MKTDQLRPEGVRELMKELEGMAYMDHIAKDLAHLCGDYLTLWEENEELRGQVAELAKAWHEQYEKAIGP